MKRFLNPVSVIAILWSIAQLYWAFFGMLHVFIVRPLHLSFAMSIVFLTKPFKKNGTIHSFDYILVLLSLIISIMYFNLSYKKWLGATSADCKKTLRLKAGTSDQCTANGLGG